MMPSNSAGFDAGVLWGRFPDRIGHLHSPARIREPKIGVPWALDNGVFGAWSAGNEWCGDAFYEFLGRYAFWKPWFAVVPDAVGDCRETERMWGIHAPKVSAFDVPLAWVAQDGSTPSDVPKDADWIFVGGSTSWKWQNLRIWTDVFERVHVGRVNSVGLLRQAEECGATSCDGTGWMRSPDRLRRLVGYLEGHEQQGELI